MKKLTTALAATALSIGALALPADATPYGPTAGMVADIVPGTTPAEIDEGAPVGSRLVFNAETAAAGNELWVSDNSAAGTKLLRDINPDAGGSNPRNFTTFGGKAYFTADDGGANGHELWVTDGTAAGTHVININAITNAGSDPAELTVAGSKLYFSANDTVHGRELWVTDGTTPGTHIINVNKQGGDPGSNPTHLTAVGSRLAFTAFDGLSGNEPWITDGSDDALTTYGAETLRGTHILANANNGIDDSNPVEFALAGGRIVFSASNGTALGLYSADPDEFVNPTLPGVTSALKTFDAPNGSVIESMTAYSGGAYFNVDNGDGKGRELWFTDGTLNGTVRAYDIEVGAGASSPEAFTVANGLLFFRASTAADGVELWRTDGSAGGTFRVADINPGADDGGPQKLVAVGSTLYFSADDGTHGRELWRTSGVGATRVTDAMPGSASSDPLPLAGISNTVFFAAADPTHGAELWSYTGVGSTTKAYPKSSYSRSAGANKKIYVTVVVRATGTTPTGKVTLKKGSTIIGYGTLSGGRKSIHITKKLGKGSHKIKAYYSGSLRARLSVSPTFTIKVR